MNFEARLTLAFAAWQDAGVVHLDRDFPLPNTLGAPKKIRGRLRPGSAELVPVIVAIAARFKIPLYTISVGRNWGYGGALPAKDECVVLDLSRLDRIINFDSDVGTVTVEPGVTQQMLYDFLRQHQLPFLVPTTGAGPTASILGNALERGYGLTPEQDHFGAILSLKAVLADGSLYQSPLTELGGFRSDNVFKWNIGPYLDGLFAQGNFGVVTQVTISLAQKPDHVRQFIVFVDDLNFENAVSSIRKIKQRLGSLVGGVNIMSKRRLLAMVERHEVWSRAAVMSDTDLQTLAARRKLPDWAIVGGIYAATELVSGAEKIVRQEVRSFAKRTIFLSRRKIDLMKKAVRFFSLHSLERTVDGMSDAMNILEGVPSRVALPLAYIKVRQRPKPTAELSPDTDGCGLIWFSPLLPIDAKLARDFTHEVTRVCISYGIEPLVTLTAISERCFDATIPVVFDATVPADRLKARACFDALMDVALEFGLFPYRLDIEATRKYFDPEKSVALRLTQRLKEAADPLGILSPGRYSGERSDAPAKPLDHGLA